MIRDVERNRIANATTDPLSLDEIEITPEMIEAGEEAILEVVGGADLGGLFSASDLAEKVFWAMWDCRQSSLSKPNK
jgi:hypothetical protein